ncbi:hypothetical protein DM860_006483 [Cuscuta australis]|uniref:Expansin n=1 Tax=Cuscuta australis TaxID=267555 RepID=A0A328D8U1_9ASTE|nr:hypothetical protein DM860_006483 [Cuscuta australis]
MAYSGYGGLRGGGAAGLIIIIEMHLVISLIIVINSATAGDNGDFNEWHSAHATAYGGANDSHKMGTGCKNENEKPSKQWHGRDNIAAVSGALFNNGSSCGQCYQIKCVSGRRPGLPGWCRPGSPSVTVMATDLCRPNYAAPPSGGGWCNPPLEHFAVAQPAWLKMVNFEAGIVPVKFRRVQCS